MVYSICNILGEYGDAPAILDHLLEQTRSSQMRSEAYLLLKHVLTGLPVPLSSGSISTLEVLVEEVITQDDNLLKVEVSPDYIQRNLLLMGLIEKSAQVLGG